MLANSVLSYIVPKLAIQTENAVSECLYFILHSSPNAAAAFLETLAPAGVPFPTLLEFSTQFAWPDMAIRPDMIGRLGAEGPIRLVVEAKFDAPLTKNQPTEYLQCLSGDEPGLLLFIAPHKRCDSLWDQLAKRCASKRLRLADRLEHTSGLMSARLDGHHVLGLISWEEVIDGLFAKLGADLVTNRAVLADLSQVDDLAKRIISHGRSGNVFDQPATNAIENREAQLRNVVNQITQELVNAGHATIDGYRPTPGPGYYKRYMTLSGRPNWCVEFNTQYWALFGESLLWMSILNRNEYRAYCAVLQMQLAQSAFERGEQFLIPLRARNAGTPDEALAQMTRQALSVAKTIADISV